MEKAAWRMIVVVMLTAVGCVSEPTYTRRSYYAPGVPYQTNAANANAVTSDRPIVIQSPTFHEPSDKKEKSFWQWLLGEPKPKEEPYAMPLASWTRPTPEPSDR